MKKDHADNITGCIISDLRKNVGLTQKELAIAFNVSTATIAHYEQGISVPPNDMLKRYADFFHVSTDYIIGRNMLNKDFSNLNELLYENMKIADMVQYVLSYSKDKRRYLYNTIIMLNEMKEKLK